MLRRTVWKSLLPFHTVLWPLLLGEGLETSTTHIVVIYSQRDIQAGIEPGHTINVRLHNADNYRSLSIAMLSTTVDGNHEKCSNQKHSNFLDRFQLIPHYTSPRKSVQQETSCCTRPDKRNESNSGPAWKLDTIHIVMYFSVLVFYIVRNISPSVRMWSHTFNFHSGCSYWWREFWAFSFVITLTCLIQKAVKTL